MASVTLLAVCFVSILGNVLSYDLQSLANPFYEAFQEANNAINSYDCAEETFNSEFMKRIYDCIGKEVPQVSEGLIDCFDNQSLTNAIRNFCGKFSQLPYDQLSLKAACLRQNELRIEYNIQAMKTLNKTFETPYSIYYESCLANTMKREGVSGEIQFSNKLQVLDNKNVPSMYHRY